MTPRMFLIAAVLSLLPISEVRGAIPYLIVKGVPALPAFLYCVVLNALVGPFLYLFLNTIHKFMTRFGWYERLFERIVVRARLKVGPQVEKYGYLGLAVFVGIPFPLTGAYTGALGAWILGLHPRKAWLAIALGVLAAGIVVTLVMVLGIGALSFFITKPESLNVN